jgi:hypothetical protein
MHTIDSHDNGPATREPTMDVAFHRTNGIYPFYLSLEHLWKPSHH